MEFPDNLHYTKEHEWVRVEEDGSITVGITDYAQEHLGDVVMVELPKVGLAISAHKVFGTVESPKSVSDLFAPIGGSVTSANDALDANPEKVNADCYGDGWMIALAVEDPAEVDDLLDAAAYAKHIEDRSE